MLMEKATTQIISYLPDNKEVSWRNLKENIICKFIVIKNHTDINLVFGMLSRFAYHANLLNKFCDENQIPSGWNRKPDLYLILDRQYKISGGYLEIDNQNKLIKVFGYSTAYGKYITEEVSVILKEKSGFEDFEIIVE